MGAARQLGGDVQKLLLWGKVPHKIVAAAAGHQPDREVRMPHRGLHHLVEGAVPAAGVQPDRLCGLGKLFRQLPRMAGAGRFQNLHLVRTLRCGRLDAGTQHGRWIFRSRHRIDDKDPLQPYPLPPARRGTPLFCNISTQLSKRDTYKNTWYIL